MNKKNEAIRLLKYYFRLIARRAGINWDSDNDAEIETALDHIFDYIDEKIDEHNFNGITHPHNLGE